MPGLLCEIVGRQKDVEAMPGMLSHFELADGLVVECEFLATDMTWSLFCYDAKSRQAVFVELPGDIDLSETPFAYVTQFNMAKRVLLVSFDELEELARLAPCPDKIVMVYSIGRCGSTLVSNILSDVPNVWSISEPDPLTNLATGNWEAEKEQLSEEFDMADISSLVGAAIRLAYRPTKTVDHTTLVIKHRSQLLFFLSEMDQAARDAANVFLYREPIAWTDSFYRFAQKQGVPATASKEDDRRFLWNILSNSAPDSRLAEILGYAGFPERIEDMLAAAWIINMNCLDVAENLDMASEMFSYDQLNNEREASVARLLKACGLDAKHVDRAMVAYHEDSQKGTASSRSTSTVGLTDAQCLRVGELVRKCAPPSIQTLCSLPRSYGIP